MATTKVYTDYLLTIWHAGERAFTDVHIRLVKPNGDEKTRKVECLEGKDNLEVPRDAIVPAIKLGRFKYKFNDVMDWAFKTKFSPWRKWSPKHPYKTFVELTRAKRIGHLHYKEPDCMDRCLDCPKYKTQYPDCSPGLIEPIHFSKFHQPSGRRVGDPVEMVQDPYNPNNKSALVPSLLESVTPRMLKDRIDNNFYREQFKSYKFGVVQKIGGKWWLIMIGVVAGILVLLYMTGHLYVGG